MRKKVHDNLLIRKCKPLSEHKTNPNQTFATYKREARTAARDFFYPKRITDAIESAKTIGEIERIMTTARLSSD